MLPADLVNAEFLIYHATPDAGQPTARSGGARAPVTMFHIILYQPQIPPNTGNIMRLCANIGARLHLIEPLGFRLEDRLLRRAGLDYREWVDVRRYPGLETCRAALAKGRIFALSTRGRRCYTDPVFHAGDAFLFGPETKGLPQGLLGSLPSEQLLRIPMQPGNRSLNLSNAVAVVLFEAWRQLGFTSASLPCAQSRDLALVHSEDAATRDLGTNPNQTNSGLGSRSSNDAVASRGGTDSKSTR